MSELARTTEEALRQNLEDMTRMQQVSTRLLQGGDFSLLLHEILDAAIEITGAQMGNIQLVEGDLLRITAQRGFEAPFLEFFDAVHGNQAACGTALQRGEDDQRQDATGRGAHGSGRRH